MSRSRTLACLLATAAVASACDIPNPGVPLQPNDLSFPIALALAPPQNPLEPSHFVVVAGANYDLRSDEAALISFDLDRIQAELDRRRAIPAGTADSCEDATRECFVGNAEGFVASQVFIDSFASGMAFSPQGDRVYLTVRSAHDLTWVDFDSGTGALSCGQPAGGFSCDEAHRTTLVEEGCARPITLTGDPNAVVAGSISDLTDDPDEAGLDWLLMVQRNGTAALYLDRREGLSRRPVLTHILTGLSLDAINASLEPGTGLTWISTASPIPARAQRTLPLVGVSFDHDRRECSSAFFAGQIQLGGLATGFDSRDVAWSEEGRFAHVLSRLPESVITIDQDGVPLTPGDAPIVDVDAVGFGPSRIASATLPDGEEYLVATCFDARNLYVLRTDPVEVASVVAGFDGPYEVAIDPVRQWAIVADFKTSVVRIVDLAPLTSPEPDDEPAVIIRIGTPRTRLGFP
jgi:hypothetical protein